METRRTGPNPAVRAGVTPVGALLARLQRRIGACLAGLAATDWVRSPLASLGLFESERHDAFCPSLPARYAAINPAASRRQLQPARTYRDHRRDAAQQWRERAARGFRRSVNRACETLNDTKHVWVLIAFLYMFVALFALVVALSVVGS